MYLNLSLLQTNLPKQILVENWDTNNKAVQVLGIIYTYDKASWLPMTYHRDLPPLVFPHTVDTYENYNNIWNGKARK